MPSYYELSYTLTEQEVKDGLLLSGLYKTTGKRAVIETIILAALFVVFIISYVMKQRAFDLIMAFICMLAAVLLNLLPRLDMKKKAQDGEKNIKLRIYKGKIYIYLKEHTLTMELDDQVRIMRSEEKGLITVYPKSGGLLMIPERIFPKGSEAHILAMLTGTDKSKDESGRAGYLNG